MKTNNFPARKNARRIAAAERGYKRATTENAIALTNTKAAIVPHDVARAIRTKKARSDKRRFA